MPNRKFSELREAISDDPVRAERLEQIRKEVAQAYELQGNTDVEEDVT